MSESQELLKTVQLLMQLSELSDELIGARGSFDFAKIHELCRQNTLLRPQLTEAMEQLGDFTPHTEQERELIGLAAPLAQKIADSDRIFRLWKANLAFMREQGPDQVCQALNNAAHLCGAPPVDLLDGLFEGIPAIVVAAGPSLDRNIHLLEELRDRAVIVSMNRCAKIFAARSLRPHFVLATDGAAELVDSHLDGVGTDVLENLILRLSVHPRMRTVPRSRTFLFTDGSCHEDGLLERMGKTHEPMGGATVAHSCLQLAYRMGCNPIVTIGQDLAYTDDRHYSETDVDANKRVIATDDGSVAIHSTIQEMETATHGITASHAFALEEIKGWHGTPVRTDETFSRYLTTFELLVSRQLPGRHFINATEGGAFIEGMEHLPLAEAAERHMQEVHPGLRERIEAAHQTYEAPVGSSTIASEIRGLQQHLLQLHKITGAGLKLLHSGRRDPGTIKQIGKAQRKLQPIFDKTVFAIRDLHLARQAEEPEDVDDWAIVESEFRIIRESVQAILPGVRDAVGALP